MTFAPVLAPSTNPTSPDANRDAGTLNLPTNIPPISSVTWEWCNIYGTTPQKPCLQEQVYHWGPVELSRVCF
jgi:hypothetical protein